MPGCEGGVSEEGMAAESRAAAESTLVLSVGEGNFFASGVFVTAGGGTVFVGGVGMESSNSSSDEAFSLTWTFVSTSGRRKSTTSNPCPSMTSPRTAFRLPAIPSRAIAESPLRRSAFGHLHSIQVQRRRAWYSRGTLKPSRYMGVHH